MLEATRLKFCFSWRLKEHFPIALNGKIGVHVWITPFRLEGMKEYLICISLYLETQKNEFLLISVVFVPGTVLYASFIISLHIQ